MLNITYYRTKQVRSHVKRNPLANPAALRKLNPHAPIIKKYARLNNEQRRAAREVLRRKRSGVKVDAKEVQKATAVLGLKNRTYKAFKSEIEKKKTAVTALRKKIAEAQVKRVAIKKAKSVTKKGTDKGKKQVKKTPPKK